MGSEAYAKGTSEERDRIMTLMLSLQRKHNEQDFEQLPTEMSKKVGDMLPLSQKERKDKIEFIQDIRRRDFLENNNGSLDRVPVDDIFVDMTGKIIYMSTVRTRRRFTNKQLELFFAMLKVSQVRHLYLNGNLIDDVTPLMNAIPISLSVIYLNNNPIWDIRPLHPNNRQYHVNQVYYDGDLFNLM